MLQVVSMRLDAKRADQTAVADLLPVPDRTAASEINVAAGDKEKPFPSEIFGSVLKAATAKKDKGLDAAIRSPGKE